LLAYIVLAHRAPGQLARLARRLSDADTHLFVHIDKKTDAATYGRMVQGLDSVPNVHRVERQKCYWGGFSVLSAILKSIRMVVDSGLRPHHTVLLTGQDYPIRPASEIVRFLRAHDGTSFLQYFPLPTDRWPNGGLDRVTRWYSDRLTVANRKPFIPFRMRSFPSGFAPFGGNKTSWLTYECLDYVHRFVAEHPSFVSFFRHVKYPDELFFQTVILNSPLVEEVHNDHLMYLRWDHAAHPATLVEHDFPQLASSEKLFARKFDIERDATILDMIDQRLLDA
jgi:hypothetical protein